MAKFRVLSGIHVQNVADEDGRLERKVYSKGQVVESDSDLTKIFPLKFEALDKTGEEKQEDEAAQHGDVERRRAHRKAARGRHHKPDGTEAKEDDND